MPLINPSNIVRNLTLTDGILSWDAATAPIDLNIGANLVRWNELEPFSYILSQLVWNTAGSAVNSLEFDFPPFDPETGEGYVLPPFLIGSGAGYVATGTAIWQAGFDGVPVVGTAYLKQVSDGSGGWKFIVHLESPSPGSFDRVYIELNYFTLPSP